MKNFVRALGYAWPYRWRLFISMVCALAAAFLWGANFTSIYPVLKMLHTGESLHAWVDGAIARTAEQVKELEKAVDDLSAKEKELDKAEPNKHIDSQKRALASDLLRLENRLTSARYRL